MLNVTLKSFENSVTHRVLRVKKLSLYDRTLRVWTTEYTALHLNDSCGEFMIHDYNRQDYYCYDLNTWQLINTDHEGIIE